MAPVYEYVASQTKPKLSAIYRIRSKPVRRLLLQYDRLSLIRGVLHRRTFQGDDESQQIILPHCLRNQILSALHDNHGHQSLQRVIDLLRERVYWPSMFVDAERWVSQCERCLISKGDYYEPKTVQGSLVSNQPLELLCIDFTKADVAKGGKENILVLTDAFSKYSQAFITPNQKSLTVAKVLVEKWFNVFGIPARIHSDQGRSFDNEIISSLCKMYGIRQSTTTPYNPRRNSQCERFNRTLFGLMRSLDKVQKPYWPNYLSALVFSYNATPHSMTGYQPYELMFGRKAPTPCDNWLGLGNYKSAEFKTKTGWLNEQLNALLHANKQALKGIQKSTKRNKDRNSGKDLLIPVGNHVLLRDHPEGRNKIQDRYKTDVYVVVGHHQEEPNVYYIQLLNSNKPGQPKVVNRRQLYDLKRSVPPSTVSLDTDGFSPIPSFLDRKHHIISSPHVGDHNSDSLSHHYSTRSKRKTAATVNSGVVKTIITHL